MKRKKLALAVVLALLVVGVALGVHLTHKDAYADWDYFVYVHSGESPITGLTIEFKSWLDGGIVEEGGNFTPVGQGWYRYSTIWFPQIEFDEWSAKISDEDVMRFGLVMVDPDENPIPRQNPGTTQVDWSVAPDMR